MKEAKNQAEVVKMPKVPVPQRSPLEMELHVMRLIEKNLRKLPELARSRVLDYLLKMREEQPVSPSTQTDFMGFE